MKPILALLPLLLVSATRPTLAGRTELLRPGNYDIFVGNVRVAQILDDGSQSSLVYDACDFDGSVLHRSPPYGGKDIQAYLSALREEMGPNAPTLRVIYRGEQ